MSDISPLSRLVPFFSLCLSVSFSLSLSPLLGLFVSHPSRLKSIPVTFIISRCDNPPPPSVEPSVHLRHLAPHSLSLAPNHESQPNLRRGGSGLLHHFTFHFFTLLTPSTDSDAPISMSETCPLGSPSTCSQRSSLSPVQFNM